MSSAWGFLWGEPWGSATEWGARADETDPASALLELRVGDLDCEQTALARLRRRFSSAESWRSLARVLGRAFQEPENAAAQLELQTKVGYATGVWLDEIGAIVNLPRAAWTGDADYRLATVAEALSRITDGSPQEVVDVAVRLAGGASITYRERYPASFELLVPDLSPGRFALMASVMGDMPPAGVGGSITTWSTATTGGWSYDPSPPSDPARWGYTGSAAGRSQWSYTRRLGT